MNSRAINIFKKDLRGSGLWERFSRDREALKRKDRDLELHQVYDHLEPKYDKLIELQRQGVALEVLEELAGPEGSCRLPSSSDLDRLLSRTFSSSSGSGGTSPFPPEVDRPPAAPTLKEESEAIISGQPNLEQEKIRQTHIRRLMAEVDIVKETDELNQIRWVFRNLNRQIQTMDADEVPDLGCLTLWEWATSGKESRREFMKIWASRVAASASSNKGEGYSDNGESEREIIENVRRQIESLRKVSVLSSGSEGFEEESRIQGGAFMDWGRVSGFETEAVDDMPA